jgi:hypothetical protein
MAGHNDARQLHEWLLDQAKEKGKVDIRAIENSIPSGKTSRADVFLEHARAAVKHFPTLYKHYKKERFARWATYQKEQRALHTLCMRVKGDPKLKKENVIVAYGSATFTSTMRGKRSVPVKRFLQHLRRYVTVVMTSEMRTSRVCSKGCGHEAGDPAGATGEEGQSSYDLIPVRSERRASGEAGPCIFAVRYCKGCKRMWNRDVNAARNIARMFFHKWIHGGGLPLWALPRPSPSS